MSDLQALSPEECWEHVRRNHAGRIGFSRGRGDRSTRRVAGATNRVPGFAAAYRFTATITVPPLRVRPPAGRCRVETG